MARLEFSLKDSERFGLRIYRSFQEEIVAKELMEEILANNVDTAIIRVPTLQLANMHKLKNTAMPTLVADTLAIYTLDLKKHQTKPLKNSALTFKIAGYEDHSHLNALVAETFGNYVNHYRANPFFDNDHVTEGYQDWMRTYAEGHDDRLCWLVYLNDDLVGFATFNFQQEELADGVLYGVKPSAAGNGIFRDMMRYVAVYAKERGCTKMRVTTQIENKAVQRVWTSEGFCIEVTHNTIHVNAMLNKSVFDSFNVPITLEEGVGNTKKVSNQQVLSQINHHFDFKQNIVTQNHRFVNFKPLQVGIAYQMHFSFPLGNKGLLKVLDNEGEVNMLVYFDLKHFFA